MGACARILATHDMRGKKKTEAVLERKSCWRRRRCIVKVFNDCLLHWSSMIVNCRVDDLNSGAPLGREGGGGEGGGEEGDIGQEAVGHREAEVACREAEAAVERTRGQEVEVPT